MPTEYTNEEKIDEVLSRTQQDLWKPNIIGQTARESLVDYSNPRRKEIAVSPGGDIQAAIDILNIEGGGTVLLKSGTHFLTANISGKNGVSIIGEGRGVTIVECDGNTYGIDYSGTSGIQLSNFIIADFTLQNSNNVAGINIDFCDFWRMENIRITSCDQDGIRIQRSSNWSIWNVRSDSNTGDGFQIGDTATGDDLTDFLVINCIADINTGNGFVIESDINQIVGNGNFINCNSNTNTVDGFDISGSSGTPDLVFLGCTTYSNSGIGFDCSLNNVMFVACNADDTGDDFEITGSFNSLISCSGFIFDVGASTGPPTTMIGCRGGSSNAVESTDPSTVYGISDNVVNSIGNSKSSTITEKSILQMKNVSGGTLTRGSVVILASNVGGDSVTTTTTAGDNKVFGVAEGATVHSNNDYGPIQVLGKTIRLKVNGTTDIAVGDYLSTYTEAGIAQKASTGHMVFAMALEAYSTDNSSGIIDALLISPRLI